MTIRDKFCVRRMGSHNPSLWFWLDVKLGNYWHVLMWRKSASGPEWYRSFDGTPPRDRSHGRWFLKPSRDAQ